MLIIRNSSFTQSPAPIIDYYPPSQVPDRVILTYVGDPATSIGITWRTAVSVPLGFAQIKVADATPNFEKAGTIAAKTELLVSDLNAAHYHSVIFTGLKPNTLYAYRVGDKTLWSEWAHFRTASAEEAPFSFIYFGDAQNDLKSKWSRTIRQAYSHMPQADFMLHAGDLINIPQRDHEWGEWFYAGGWINQMMPSVMTPGNHEYQATSPTERVLSRHWRPSFTLPENGPQGLEETVFYFDHQGTRVISLNSQAFLLNPEDSAKQVIWLEKILAENPNKWTVVTMHHPIYSPAFERDNPNLRNGLKPLFDKYNVDIILQGHDHTYARGGNNLPSGAKVLDSTGPVYVVSVSGPKMYPSGLTSWIDRAAMETQLYQLIHINNDSLTYEAFTTIGELYDKFQIIKNEAGDKKFIDMTPENVPELISDKLAKSMSEEDWKVWEKQFEAYKARKGINQDSEEKDKKGDRRN
ncbi:MAG: metallophosphoesterase family protein [Saprospiraceae bacterium]|nr:metallophosphoesterase family protein [Saprospiraceae bacterium]